MSTNLRPSFIPHPLRREDESLSAAELLRIRSQDQGPLTKELQYFGRQHDPKLSGGLRFHVLGSGSKGNSAVVEGPSGAILIDAGFSKKESFLRLEQLGISRASIKAIILTHEHADHAAGIGVLSRGLQVPVYASDGTRLHPRIAREISCIPLRSRDKFELAGMQITSFPTSHDAQEPLGLRIQNNNDSLAYLTDCGVTTPEIYELLSEVRILALETNHDPQLLEKGPYPASLKARIASEIGHLSNQQAAETLQKVYSKQLETVVAMHLSETNNTAQLSFKSLHEALPPKHSCLILPAWQNRPLTIG